MTESPESKLEAHKKRKRPETNEAPEFTSSPLEQVVGSSEVVALFSLFPFDPLSLSLSPPVA
jgi:hypothetical protein